MIFLFPTPIEAAPFKERCPNANVIICGVGMAATAATIASIVKRDCEPEIVILAGIAGAYDTTLNPINQVVEVVSEQIEELPQKFAIRYETDPKFGLVQVDANSVNSSNQLGATAQIENMEGAVAMAMCNALSIPFAQIRAISNRVGDDPADWHFESAIEALTNSLITIYNNR